MRTPKQKKDQEKELTKAHHDFERSMNSYAFFKTNNRATSQDLVQDTFIKTWEYLVRGGNIVLMRAFLYHVLNQLIIDEYRKHRTSSLDAILDKGYEPKFDETERIINTMDGKSVFLLIQFLPKKYEKVIRMRYEQNLSLEEIALITKQSKNTTAVQLHRGLIKLKELYTQVI